MEVDYRQLPSPAMTKEKSDKAELYHVLGLKGEEGWKSDKHLESLGEEKR